uniref:PGG domain-containing protein n=1 Tax=Oryza punctata TaxID=4537 RepID=A0A0E0MDJ5_ORYPU
MDPRLLRAARRGDREWLEAVLGAAPAPDQVAVHVAEDAAAGPPDPGQQAADQPPPPPSAAALLLDVATTPRGDSALHVVAASGDSDDFLRCARTIYHRATRLLDRTNAMGDTPLHCAARAGNAAMVACLLDVAAAEERRGATFRVADVLERQNRRRETALHDAVRLGDEQIVGHLMAEHPRLASLPGGDGMSPLYLAVSLGHDSIADLLHRQGNDISYAGPAGQTALHAAVLRGAKATEKILQWNNGISGEADASGSTALHFAASADGPEIGIENSLLLRWLRLRWPCHGRRRRTSTQVLLEADPSLACRPDSNGEYPIHVAASMGNLNLVALLLRSCPECVGLRDARGRTFLHVAVDRRREAVVEFATDGGRTSRLAGVLNAQDDDGNTALHLAVISGVLKMFCYLIRNGKVRLDLANNDGLTPADLSRSTIPAGLYYKTNARMWILWSLVAAEARGGNIRRDHFDEQYVLKLDESAESKKMTDSTQIMGIGSVLVATVAFAVAFSPPGGYAPGVDGNGRGNLGAPALAGRYAFDAFMYAVAVAFTCSMLATFSLIYAGTAAVEWKIRHKYFKHSLSWMRKSTRSLLVAFALGVYLVLAPVSRATAVGVCVLTAGTLLFRNREQVRMLICTYMLKERMGIMVVFKVGLPIAFVLLQSSLVYFVIFGGPLWTPLCVLLFLGKIIRSPSEGEKATTNTTVVMRTDVDSVIFFDSALA